MEGVIAVDGDWDLATAAGWQDRIFAVIDHVSLAGSSVDVVLDMSAVAFIDSTGLSVLSRVRTHAITATVRLRLRGPSPQLMRLLMMTGMSQVFEIERIAQPGQG